MVYISIFPERVATALLLLLILAVVFVVVAPCFGWGVYSVYSGSMEPSIRTGDLVITEPISTNDIRVGDIITFMSQINPTCHRVVAVEDNPLRFTTRGDSNESPDPNPVLPGMVLGKVVVNIPLAGYLSHFIKSPLGLLLTIIIPGLLIIGFEVRALLFERDKE